MFYLSYIPQKNDIFLKICLIFFLFIKEKLRFKTKVLKWKKKFHSKVKNITFHFIRRLNCATHTIIEWRSASAGVTERKEKLFLFGSRVSTNFSQLEAHANKTACYTLVGKKCSAANFAAQARVVSALFAHTADALLAAFDHNFNPLTDAFCKATPRSLCLLLCSRHGETLFSLGKRNRNN